MRIPRSTLRKSGRILLGLLVVWQLAFLGLSTLDVLVTGGPLPQDEPFDPQVLASGRTVGLYDEVPLPFRPSRMWSKLSMQRQYWRLFPSFPDRSIFPTVKLIWRGRDGAGSDRIVACASDYEPTEPGQLFSLDYHAVRVFNYEQNVALLYIPWDDDDVNSEPDEYCQYRHDRLRSRWRVLQAYMRRQVDAYRRSHPSEPTPDEVILEVRVVDTPHPEQSPWQYGPVKQRPIARWCPRETSPPGVLPLHAFDPKSGEFQTVARNL